MKGQAVHWKRHLTSFRLIILGFAGVIVLGALLLSLPIASADGRWTPFRESLFTATSAVCVTGLVIHDTGSYWSLFGQGIILLMIQIGGLGVVTAAAMFMMFAGKHISIRGRSAMQDALSAPAVGGIVRLTIFILKGTFIIELLGAAAMLPVFLRDFGAKGIWMSLFHSVSAFCNAGFDIMGSADNQYVSMMGYADNVLIVTVLILLIVIGGIGFLTWNDICTHKLKIHRYRLQSKVILAASGVLIFFPALLFFFTDYAQLPIKERFLLSLFQAVTPRTAGFNTADLSSMTEISRAAMIVLMLIGGAPGSTAGGMKVTTATVLMANAFATFRRRESPQIFRRRLDDSAAKNASAILMMYIALFFTGAMIISAAEGTPLYMCLFETASAVGTVGLSLGLTPGLGSVSQWVLIALMFIGRVGGLTLIYATFSGHYFSYVKYPKEQITVG